MTPPRTRGRARRAARDPGAFPPEAPDDGLLTALRRRLGEVGYDEGTIAKRLGVPHIAALSLDRYPVYLGWRLDPARPLDLAIALFLLEDEVDGRAAEGALGTDVVGGLVDVGLLRPAGGGRARAGARVSAEASLFPCLGALLATDHRFRHLERVRRRAPREPVMYLGGDSYALACATVRRPIAAALDLCTGSGVHAILAARHAKRVVATDLNGRAVRFARFNAALNGVAARVEVRECDLDGAVPADLRFDLVLANPPFVPSPYGQRSRGRIAFRDAGETGEDVLARIVGRLGRRLARDGLAFVVTTLVEEAGRPYRRKLAAWAGRGAELSCLAIRFGSEDPGDYAVAQVRSTFSGERYEAYAARLARWIAALGRARAARVGGGVLVFKPCAGPTPSWYREASPPPRLDAFGEAVERALKATEAARGVVFRDELHDRRARLAPDLVLEDVFGPDRDGSLAPRSHRAEVPSSLSGEVGVGAELRAFLGRADGSRTLRALLEETAKARGETFEATAARLARDVIALVERGLLVLERA